MPSREKFNIREQLQRLERHLAETEENPVLFFAQITREEPGITPERIKGTESTADICFWRKAYFYVLAKAYHPTLPFKAIGEHYAPYTDWRNVKTGFDVIQGYIEAYNIRAKALPPKA